MDDRPVVIHGKLKGARNVSVDFFERIRKPAVNCAGDSFINHNRHANLSKQLLEKLGDRLFASLQYRLMVKPDQRRRGDGTNTE